MHIHKLTRIRFAIFYIYFKVFELILLCLNLGIHIHKKKLK